MSSSEENWLSKCRGRSSDINHLNAQLDHILYARRIDREPSACGSTREERDRVLRGY